MSGYKPISSYSDSELTMYQCGAEECSPGHSYGPAVRDHFLIHYISRGRGRFYVGDREFSLGAGQGFLICPGVITFYRADMDDPWQYAWVGFHGLKAESYLKAAGLTLETPIFACERDEDLKDCLGRILGTRQAAPGGDVRITGLLHIFISHLIEASGRETDESKDKKELYVEKALQFIRTNYSQTVKVSDIARYVGLDRSYLGSVFRERMSCSLQDYIIRFRVERACELMSAGGLSIGDVSRSVGYDDQLQFSRRFKKIKGLSPREYRQFRKR